VFEEPFKILPVMADQVAFHFVHKKDFKNKGNGISGAIISEWEITSTISSVFNDLLEGITDLSEELESNSGDISWHDGATATRMTITSRKPCHLKAVGKEKTLPMRNKKEKKALLVANKEEVPIL